MVAILDTKHKRIRELEAEIEELKNKMENSPQDAPTTSKKRRLVVEPSPVDEEISATKSIENNLDGNAAKMDAQNTMDSDEEQVFYIFLMIESECFGNDCNVYNYWFTMNGIIYKFSHYIQYVSVIQKQSI